MNNPRAGSAQRVSAVSTEPAVKDEAFFLASLPVIDDVSAYVCRRHRLSGAEAEDFRSEVRLHFLERNYEVLRRFEGRSSLPTYVTVVIQRLYLDYRNRQWGKWRPSAEARRVGPAGILLERLAARDGLTLEQAVETLRLNHGIELDEPLRALTAKIAKRSPGRLFVAEDAAAGIEGGGLTPDANVLRAEQGFLAKRVKTALDRARQGLLPEERLILKMRFEDSFAVSQIAAALRLDQKKLYRTIDRLLARLRTSLAAEGLSSDEVSALFVGDGFNVDMFAAEAPTLERSSAAAAHEGSRG
jgi:RNA polymerase sigma factor (sigma-70 family)